MFTVSADCARVEYHMAAVSLGQLLLSPLLPLLLPSSSELLQSFLLPEQVCEYGVMCSPGSFKNLTSR